MRSLRRPRPLVVTEITASPFSLIIFISEHAALLYVIMHLRLCELTCSLFCVSGSRQLFSLLSVTSYSSLALHKLTLLVYNSKCSLLTNVCFLRSCRQERVTRVKAAFVYTAIWWCKCVVIYTTTDRTLNVSKIRLSL